MKGLRSICIIALAVVLILSSVGTVFAKGPPDGDHGKNKSQGEKQGFVGNVSAVSDGNVTIVTEQGWTGNITLKDEASYKIPRVMNKWGNLSEFINNLGGNLIALQGRRVVVLAGNASGIWEALKLLALPVPGTQPLHAHRTGLVYEFNKPSDSSTGNITIVDVHGVHHTFTVGNSTVTLYRPIGTEAGNITADITLQNSSLVTVVTTGNPKAEPPLLAKAIVLHPGRPEGWPIMVP